MILQIGTMDGFEARWYGAGSEKSSARVGTRHRPAANAAGVRSGPATGTSRERERACAFR